MLDAGRIQYEKSIHTGAKVTSRRGPFVCPLMLCDLRLH